MILKKPNPPILPNYSVVILCGGKSSRMQQDKAMLDWNGKPLAMYIADGFSSCDDLFLSVRDVNQFSFPGYRMVSDEITGSGPIAGLTASLKAARHDILFVTTCDAPLVNAQTANYLVEQLEDYDAVVPVTGGLSNGKMHPLIAVYQKRVLPLAQRNLLQGKRKMTMLLQNLRVKYVDGALLPGGIRSLTNLNTPEDLHQII